MDPKSRARGYIEQLKKESFMFDLDSFIDFCEKDIENKKICILVAKEMKEEGKNNG